MKRRELLLALSALACARRSRVASPPPAPRFEQPGRAIPADLDLVLRLDFERLRAVIGEDVLGAAVHRLETLPAAEPDAATSRLVLGALSRARTLWVGVRPGLSPELTDNVLVLRGNFDALVPAALEGVPAWSRARDLGGGVLRFERAAPRLRAAPAVVYWRSPDLLVFGSYAEIDALERSVEEGRGDPPLLPSDSGLASLSVRLTQLRARLGRRARILSRLLDGVEMLTASADLERTALALQLELTLDSPERAIALAEALRSIAAALAMAPERAFLASASIEPLQRFISLRVQIPESELLHALRCFSDRDCRSGDTVPAP